MDQLEPKLALPVRLPEESARSIMIIMMMAMLMVIIIAVMIVGGIQHCD